MGIKKRMTLTGHPNNNKLTSVIHLLSMLPFL